MDVVTESYEDLFKDQEYHSLYTNLAMIGDPDVLVRTLKLYPDFEDIAQLQQHFVEANPFQYSTRSYRKRLFLSLKKLLLRTFDSTHEHLLVNLARKNVNKNFYRIVLYLQVGLNSKLFREITLNVFAKKRSQGALKLTKHSIDDYLLDNVPATKEWSETTVNRLGTRYLSLMYMFGFIEGEDRQTMAIYSPALRHIAYATYLDQILTKNPFIGLDTLTFQLLFLNDHETLVNKLKDLSLDGYFDLEVAGGEIKVKSLLEVDKFVDKLTQ